MSEALLAKVRGVLATGDPMAAYDAIRPLVEYPAAALDDAATFSAAMSVFAEIARGIAGEPLASQLVATSARRDDPNALYTAAHSLYEQGLYRIAATLLMRANRVAPGIPAIVCELSANLEAVLLYGQAALALDLSGAAERDPMVAYLSGFNWLMSGDLDVPKKRVATLAKLDDPRIGPMREALEGMILRADALIAAGIALNDRSLTAWQAAIDGTVLLHESPAGYDDPMHGRYAYLSDSAGLMREGIDRLATVLAMRPMSRVVAAPDRASHILALATAKALGVPMVPFAPGQEREGLVVAWNMDAVGDPTFAEALRFHHPGQVLFVHASSWVEAYPYAPDVTTLLHQTITHPYLGGALRVNPETQKVEPAAPDTRDDDALAAEILASTPHDPSATSLEIALAAARALAALPEVHRGGLSRTTGHRTRQRSGSPVPSNRF